MKKLSMYHCTYWRKSAISKIKARHCWPEQFVKPNDTFPAAVINNNNDDYVVFRAVNYIHAWTPVM